MAMLESLQPFLDIFGAIVAARKDELTNRGFVLKTGTHLDAAVLKMLRDAWTSDSHEKMQNKCGIFFSIWVDLPSLRAGVANYNIHALKLRNLANYRLKSREFAAEFRLRVRSAIENWPAVDIDLGPLTLLQGTMPLEMQSFEPSCRALMDNFAAVAPVIDTLLAEHHR